MPSNVEAARRLKAALETAISEDYLKYFLPNFQYAARLTKGNPVLATNEQRNFTQHISRPLSVLLKIMEATDGRTDDNELDQLMLEIERGRRHITLATYFSIAYVIVARSKTVASVIVKIERRERLFLRDARIRLKNLHREYDNSRKPSIQRRSRIDQVMHETRKAKEICNELNDLADQLDRMFRFLMKRYLQTADSP